MRAPTRVVKVAMLVRSNSELARSRARLPLLKTLLPTANVPGKRGWEL